MRLWMLCVVAGLCIGCGSSTQVHGTVTLDGKPVEAGSISFEPVNGVGPSFGASITAGRYHVPADPTVTAGKKRVQIRGSMKTGKQVPAGPPAPQGTMTDELIYYPPVGKTVPPLEAEIVAGKDNELSFDVESPRP